MNRAFKTVFHNGEEDEKAIVTISCAVNNGKRFNALNAEGKRNLVDIIDSFQVSLNVFKQELIDGRYSADAVQNDPVSDTTEADSSNTVD